MSALRHRDLALLLVTWGVWVSTDWALLITVSLVALELDGPTAVGLVGAARVLPAAVLTSPLSVLTDRWSRPRLLAVVYAGWALLAVLLAWVVSAAASFGLLLVVVGVGSALAAAVRPTLQAMVPTLVGTPGELIGANSAYATVEGLGTVLGPALCAAGLAVLGEEGVLLVLAGLFVVGAVAAGAVRTPYQPARPPVSGAGGAWLAPLKGFAVLAGRPVRLLFALSMAQTTMRGLLNVFVVLVAASLSGDTDALTGSVFVSMGIGGLVGAALGAFLGSTRRGTWWLALGISLWGVPVVVLGIWTGPTVALLAVGVVGLGNAILDVFGYSLLNRLFPDHVAGRAWGAYHAASAAVVAIGSLLAPFLATELGLTGAMVLSGGILAATPWLAWPWLRRVEARATGRTEDVDLLRRVPMLAPMSLIGLERLARAATPMTVDAGATVVTEGEPADCFYVVESGTLSVSRVHEPVRSLGPTSCFGELGLLERAPRSATVVADVPSALLRIDGDDFVSAVTGHRPTDDAVRRTVSTYLGEDERRRAHE